MCIYQSWSKTMQHSCMSNSVATSRICHIWVLSLASQHFTGTIPHQSRSSRSYHVVCMLHLCVPIDVRLGGSSWPLETGTQTCLRSTCESNGATDRFVSKCTSFHHAQQLLDQLQASQQHNMPSDTATVDAMMLR